MEAISRWSIRALPEGGRRRAGGLEGLWVDWLRRSPAYYRALWSLGREPEVRLGQIHLEATNLCNLRCVTCHNPKQKAPTGMMSMEMAREVIDQAWAAIGPEGVLGFYIRGESTLHGELPEMIGYARQRGFRRLLLSTNAARLKPAQIEGLLEAGLSELRLSMDGADAQTFERIRVGASHRRVCANVEALDRARRRVGSACVFRLHAALDAQGFGQIPRFVRRWAHVVQRFKFTVAVNQGGLFDEATARALSGMRFATSTAYQIPCRLLFGYAGVTWDGKITSCCVDYDEHFLVGRLDEGIEATFLGERAEALRSSHLRGDFGVLCGQCGFASALVDWFEDEVERYVSRHFGALCDPALDGRFERWLGDTVERFNALAAEAEGPGA